jgi:hypothetical protein
MDRSEILKMMAALQLSGMRAAYDEIVTTGIKRKHSVDQIIAALLKGKRPLATAAVRAWRRASDRVKHTVLIRVVMDGKRHGGRDHLDGGAAASLA